MDKYIMSLVGPSALSSLVLPGPLCGFLSWNSFFDFLFLFLSFWASVFLFLCLLLSFRTLFKLNISPFLQTSACFSWRVQSLNCFSSWHLPPWRSVFCSNLLIGLSLECKLFEDKDFTSLFTVVSNTYRQKYLFKWMYMYELVHGPLNLEA